MHSVQTTIWDPQPPSKHVSPLPGPPPSHSRLTHVTTAAPAKRITFYKSGDSQFGGIRMAIHKRSFKCFDALLDDLSQKVPLPFGVRTVTTPHGTHTIRHLEQLQDGGCYLCSDRRQAKPINMELASKRPSIWYHHSRRPQRPETLSATPPGHLPYRQRRILLVKNSEPGMRRSVVLSRRSTRNLRAFLDEVSEVMQFHVRKLYTTEGRRIETVQSLMTCPGVLVCVGREAFSPVLVNFIRKSSEEKLPGLGSRSPGLGPRTPGNGARSPPTQGARSPPHGAQSTTSEYSEGHESKKNVNFGLETKKSIIHPRSDSSNRSTRFSLSSEKSYGNGVSAYSQARPAVMNDDIEKRVLVNKDGSLSVEMRVRFRLHSDETLQWSTQIKKSPSLTNDSCPLSQAEPHYLQQGQSESSDPDSMSFDREHVDYPSQSLQHALEVNHCPCCYQRQEQQYDLWENPTHLHKKPPVPPPHPHTSSHTHTIMRETHSASSSSSCNSRRVVRCRAQLSSCRGGSASEQSQLVQEEMCMTEQIERRVDVEQDGDTHVEVCRVSQSCSHTEVVAMEGNLRPLSRKSVKDELEEDEGERPVSAISSSSHILQSLKEDQDDEDEDLPPSASQCCHCSKASLSSASQAHLNDYPTSHSTEHKTHGDGKTRGSRAVSATSSFHHRALTPHSTAGADEMNRTSSTKSKVSRVSGRSSESKVPNSEEEVVADDEDEEVQRVVSGLSGHRVLSACSLKSGAISVCPVCGGCKRGVSSLSNDRVSQKSGHFHQASSNPASLLPNQEDETNGIDNDDSDDSAVSTQSNRTNLTNHGCLTNGLEGRASSAMSRKSNLEPEGNEDDKAPITSLAKSYTSNKSHKSGCNGATGVTAEENKERSPSNMSAQSNLSAKSSKSHKSSCSGTAAAPDIRTREEAEGEDAAEGTVSSLSVKSDVSAKTNDSVKSHKSHCPLSLKVASPNDNMAMEEQGDTSNRAPSNLSVKSNTSVKSGKAQRPNSALSATSNITAKSACSDCASAASGAKVVDNKETGQEEGTGVEERAASVMSVRSNLSVKSNKSHKSTKASRRSLPPRSEAEIDGVERAASNLSARSVKSVKSCKSNYNDNGTVVPPSLDVAGGCEEKENEMIQVETQQRPESVKSVKSEKEERAPSAGSSKCSNKTRADSEKGDNTGDNEEPKDQAASVLSCKSASSAVCHHTKAEMDGLHNRTSSALSVKSHISATSSKSKKSNYTAASPDPSEAAVSSVASAMSVKSKSSARANKTLKLVSPSHNVVTIKTPEGFDEEGNETIDRAPSAASAKSEKSNVSSALSLKSNYNGTVDVSADANIKVVEGSGDSHGQMLSPKGIHSPRTDSPKEKSPHSPVQQLLPGGETREPSVLSVHSRTSAKSGRSKCRCGAASAKNVKRGEDEEVVKKEENEELKLEQGSERAASIMSSSSKRWTELPLSRNSSGSVSLGLPEDKEAAESDSGKSSVSFYTNIDDNCRVKAPDFLKNPEESAVLERTGSTMSQKSNSNHNKSSLSHNPPAVDIPTIENPGAGQDGAKGGEKNIKRTDKSSRSHKSSCKCRVKSRAQTIESEKKEERARASPTKDQIVKSASTTKAVVTTYAADSANSGTENQTVSSPDYGLSPESGASTQLKQTAEENSVKSDHLNPVKGHKSRSDAGSNSGSAKTSNSERKETLLKPSSPCPVHKPHSKVETCSASSLSPSQSAAELLRESMAAAQSKPSQTSDRPKSENSARCKRSRKREVREELELTPACLPYASPSEVVSDWLRSIPADTSMLELCDELKEFEQEKELEEKPGEEVAKEEESADVDTLDKEEKSEVQEEEDKDGGFKCDATEKERSPDRAPGDAVATSCPDTLLMTGESLPRNWDSSAAVMKVLLSSSLGRCRSMPEVSPVYGRRLSTSARGLLDCLAQLQLIEPAVSPGCHQHKDPNQQYENIMGILQSLWLTEPKENEAMEAKDNSEEQVTPPRSSSGVGMSSGSGGSGKENGNQGEEETATKDTVSSDEVVQKAVEEEKERNAEVGEKESKVEAEETLTEKAMTDIVDEPVQSEQQSTVPPSLDSPKDTENPSSVDKSSAKDSSKSPTDNEQEMLEDSSSCTPPTVVRAPLTKRFSQEPDPVWVLHLLKKLEKQFMSHYVNAMAEFKVRWDLDDSLVLNNMITELRDEVGRRIQSSIEREMRKIQSRAGKGGRSPRPPQEGNLSRESTMTEKRRRMLKVMKNQSVKTADSLSDEEIIGDYSDQRSDDEYCPCDACVRKKMAARPLKTNPMAAEAPVMVEFDLLKILQRKKSPLPAAVPQPAQVESEIDEEEDQEEKNLEVVQEEEEEDETKEDIKADVVLEETIAEEDEDIRQKEDEGEIAEEEEVGAENEGNSVGDEEQEEEETSGKEWEEDKASENGEWEEEEEEAKCQCCCGSNYETGDKAEEEERETEGEEIEKMRNDTGEDETADDEERAGEEELQSAEDDGEAGDNEEETGTGEEESEKETVKEATAGEGETTENGEAEEEEEEQKEEGETEDDNSAKKGENEESTMVEGFVEGNVSTSAEAEDEDEGESQEDEQGGETGEQGGETSEAERASPTQRQGLTPAAEGEEADIEESDTDCKRPSETVAEESGGEADDGTTGDEEQKEEGGGGDEEEVVEDAVEEFKPEDEEEVNSNTRDDGALLHQFTRTSVESQPGSLEDIDTDSPGNSIEAPEMATGGVGRKHHKPEDSG